MFLLETYNYCIKCINMFANSMLVPSLYHVGLYKVQKAKNHGSKM